MDMQGGQPINSQQLSYEQFQAQVRQREQQEQRQAQEALKRVGLDPKSQQVQQVIQQLNGIERELQQAENQLQMQMDAQRRQIKLLQQKIQHAVAHIQGIGSNSNSVSNSYRQ
ncbi:hypothetical protein A8990_12266 [Paenibacillus taihuensis]|uniref:FlxA-like protein n=1 Tax=Paenibacillus taihuensis TaxID=1156355 RepID=A0A3D9RTR6_9BACL|nr:hypothetical protein [Paenibacillus taihuensis]REE80112.1 hypothetical protein A8990_12266 [Paenibacillus taihuensis]